MNRSKEFAKYAFYATCRALARVLPPGLLYVVLMPYPMLRGIRPALEVRHLPASEIPAPAPDRTPSYFARWRFHMKIHQRWLPLLWTDRWDRSPWKQRLVAEGAENFDKIAAEQPIVVLTLHTGGIVALGGWIMQRGIGIGSVVIDQRAWPAIRSGDISKRWGKFGDSAAFLPGDTRAMIRYLKPGRCLFLPADHPLGRSVEGTWDGGRLVLSRGAFRIARLTGATVIPIVVMDDGRWRFRIHVGQPVPQAFIDSGDETAAASHVARELMPIAARRPKEAMVTLVAATLPPAEPATPPQPRATRAGSYAS